MAAQLRAQNIEVRIDPETYPNGRFARLHDPEGNAVERSVGRDAALRRQRAVQAGNGTARCNACRVIAAR